MVGLEAFFAFLAGKIGSASKWLRAYFSDEDGQIRDASPDNTVKYGNIRASGDVNINNVNMNLVVDTTSPEYSHDQFMEILAEISKQISSHSGLSLGLDEDFVEGAESRSSSPLTEKQKNQLKGFIKVGWNLDKINSIATAYRIINAEDAGKFVQAGKLMDSAFKGRKKVLNRKMYNLARAGYLDRFAVDVLFSPEYGNDESISSVLEYFPDAIFLDQDFLEEDLIVELMRREKEKVQRVSVYARGRRKIEIMENGYDKYLGSKIDTGTRDSTNKRTLFMIEKKMLYKLGDGEAENLELRFKMLDIKDLTNQNLENLRAAFMESSGR